MSTVYNPVGQCYGKVRHLTRAHAKQIRKRYRDGSLLHVYRCPHCGFFHLGNKVEQVAS